MLNLCEMCDGPARGGACARCMVPLCTDCGVDGLCGACLAGNRSNPSQPRLWDDDDTLDDIAAMLFLL